MRSSVPVIQERQHEIVVRPGHRYSLIDADGRALLGQILNVNDVAAAAAQRIRASAPPLAVRVGAQEPGPDRELSHSARPGI
jgi:hypothetical protein